MTPLPPRCPRAHCAGSIHNIREGTARLDEHNRGACSPTRRVSTWALFYVGSLQLVYPHGFDGSIEPRRAPQRCRCPLLSLIASFTL